jgi:hypothetical protein
VVGRDDLTPPFNFGWFLLNLNATLSGADAVPPEDPAAAQAFVSGSFDSEGRFSSGFRSLALDSATNASHNQLGGSLPDRSAQQGGQR